MYWTKKMCTRSIMNIFDLLTNYMCSSTIHIFAPNITSFYILQLSHKHFHIFKHHLNAIQTLFKSHLNP